MKKALHLLIDYWYIPALVVGAILFWILTAGKRTPPVSTVARELEAIQAGKKAREMELQLGKERAAEELRIEHASAIAALDEEKAEKAKELENDPVAFSRFIVRAGRT